MPCDEAASISSQCAISHDALSRDLLAWRGKRGLFVDIGGDVESGLGHLLPNAFLIFDVCWQLRRYCHIRMYKSRLSEMLRYASSPPLSWAPPLDDEYPRESTVVLNRSSPAIARGLLRGYGTHLVTSLSRGELAGKSLIHLRAEGSTHLRLSSSRFLPVGLPGDPSTAQANPRLTRCFCRFVSEPMDAPPSSPQLLANATVTVQLRTGYADVEDELLQRLSAGDPRGDPHAYRHRRGVYIAGDPQPEMESEHTTTTNGRASASSLEATHTAGRDARAASLASSAIGGAAPSLHEAARWLEAACPPPSSLSLHQVHVLTDAPALHALLRLHQHLGSSRLGGRAKAMQGVTGATRLPLVGIPSTITSTTRSWRAPVASVRLAVADLVRGSLSETVYVGESAFPRPMIARSVCIRSVRHLLTHPDSPCPHASSVYDRGLYGAAAARRNFARRNWSAWLPPIHPCRTSLASRSSALACEASYLAAISGVTVAAAKAALLGAYPHMARTHGHGQAGF